MKKRRDRALCSLHFELFIYHFTGETSALVEGRPGSSPLFEILFIKMQVYVEILGEIVLGEISQVFSSC